MDIRNIEYAQTKTRRLFELLNKQNNDVLAVICERIEDLGAKDINQLKSVLEYSIKDLSKIEKIIANTSGKSLSEISQIFEQTAQDNLHFAEIFYKYRQMTPRSETDAPIRQLIQAVSSKTQHEFLNITNSTTVGFVNSSGQFRDIRSNYFSLIDNAITAAATGKEDYYTTMQNVIKSMSDSGLRARFEGINKKGKPYVYTRRLDSQVMMNVQDGIRQLSTEIQRQTAAEYGADGVEISAHPLCAPDHLGVQGKQYSNEKFEELQATLKRPISTMNCRHFAFPIIMGVNQAVYSNEELKQMARDSNKYVKYTDLRGNEKEMTRYNATQRQRQFELEIRKAKEKQKAYKTAGDKLNESRLKKEALRLKKQYVKFSNEVELKINEKRIRIGT